MQTSYEIGEDIIGQIVSLYHVPNVESEDLAQELRIMNLTLIRRYPECSPTEIRKMMWNTCIRRIFRLTTKNKKYGNEIPLNIIDEENEQTNTHLPELRVVNDFEEQINYQELKKCLIEWAWKNKNEGYKKAIIELLSPSDKSMKKLKTDSKLRDAEFIPLPEVIKQLGMNHDQLKKARLSCLLYLQKNYCEELNYERFGRG